MAEIGTISKNINTWECFRNIEKAVVFLSYNHTGRSTLCELIKKYIYRS